MSKGRLVLVAGPSGVGKDAVLDGARRALHGRHDIVFPRRVITRAPSLGGEDYVAVSEADFRAMLADGAFALSWPAHGLRYGIPAGIDDDLAAGRQVVVNVSRAILVEARRKYPGALTVGISASPEVLHQRLRQRGRETEAEIAARLARAEAFLLEGENTVILSNDGALADTVARFVALLETVH